MTRKRAQWATMLGLSGLMHVFAGPNAMAAPGDLKPLARITAPPLESMSPDTRAAYDMNLRAFGESVGPRVPLFNSPEVHQAWDSLAKALDKSPLPRKLRELAILTVGATWKSDFEWYVHAKSARQVGLAPDVIEAIHRGVAPRFTNEDESAVYRYAMELQKTHQVSDETYNAAWKLLGTRALVDLTVLIGHYTNVSMTLNAHKIPLPKGVPPQF